jgi:hypothetical protein
MRDLPPPEFEGSKQIWYAPQNAREPWLRHFVYSDKIVVDWVVQPKNLIQKRFLSYPSARIRQAGSCLESETCCLDGKGLRFVS